MSTDWQSMRASDADRERAADVLKAAVAEGRLDWDEHSERLDIVMRSRTYGELHGQIVDLPVGPLPFPTQLPAPGAPDGSGTPSIPLPPRPGVPGISGGTSGEGTGYAGRLPAPHDETVGRSAALPSPRMPPPAPLANPWANYVPAPVRVTEPLAKVSIACAILGLCTSGMSAVPAIVTGHLALARIRRTNDDGAGLAVTGLVLGYLELAFVALWFILVILFNVG
ncbi:DUF1707 and DUF4190 domain-containing protein [Actinopolymorpha sp. B17G11]|uniref:DUF1707 and DUF4190 domain-containing protein n=1 Tax=unclassified Actinopolymorpha TaxID=2627063 RepID=UPI0032D96FB9